MNYEMNANRKCMPKVKNAWSSSEHGMTGCTEISRFEDLDEYIGQVAGQTNDTFAVGRPAHFQTQKLACM
jgi:hypothetical protein